MPPDPTLLAAFLLGIKRAIHEQNMVPGMTNRILKWFSQRIFVSFEETRRYFPEKEDQGHGKPDPERVPLAAQANRQKRRPIHGSYLWRKRRSSPDQ